MARAGVIVAWALLSACSAGDDGKAAAYDPFVRDAVPALLRDGVASNREAPGGQPARDPVVPTNGCMRCGSFSCSVVVKGRVVQAAVSLVPDLASGGCTDGSTTTLLCDGSVLDLQQQQPRANGSWRVTTGGFVLDQDGVEVTCVGTPFEVPAPTATATATTEPPPQPGAGG